MPLIDTARMRGSREGQRLAQAQRSLVAPPFQVRGDGHEGAEADERDGEQVPSERDAGKGGRNWAMASPATTRAIAVRFQARKVRSLAKVNLASGSLPSSGSAPSMVSRVRRAKVLTGRRSGRKTKKPLSSAELRQRRRRTGRAALTAALVDGRPFLPHSRRSARAGQRR